MLVAAPGLRTRSAGLWFVQWKTVRPTLLPCLPYLQRDPHVWKKLPVRSPGHPEERITCETLGKNDFEDDDWAR